MTTAIAATLANPRNARLLKTGWQLLLVLVASLYLVRQASDGPYGKDFTIFVTGAHILTSGQGADLYDLTTQAEVQRDLGGGVRYPGGVLPFNYPPYVAMLFTPLSWVPPDVAYYLWIAILWGVLLVLALSIRARYLRWQGGPMPPIYLLALFSFVPIYEALLMGQMSLVLLALWWWVFSAWRQQNWAQLGLAVGLAAFKPQMVILLCVALLVQKHWRALLYAALTQLALWGAAVLLAGPKILTSYIGMLQVSSTTTGSLGFSPEAMPNLRGLLTMTGLPPGLVLQLAMLSWLLSIAAVALVWRAPWPLPTRFGITALLAVILSPHLYIHDASLLILAVICAFLAHAERGATPNTHWLLVSFALLFAGIYSVIFSRASYAFVILSMVLFAILLLVSLLHTIAPKTASRPLPKPSPGEV
ncbi:MAG TPA: glycosyltransferase family 87 protein [Chloroflexia bacterium]|jgi:hypothetical protein